jgi:hypothetical protein
MPQVGPVAYAATADLLGSASAYIRDPSSTVNATIATILLNSASRFIDEKCGRFFYNDGSYTRFFDGGSRPARQVTVWPDMFASIGTVAPAGAGATSLTFTPAPGVTRAPIQGDTLALDIGLSYEQVAINGAVTGTGPYVCPVATTRFAHVANGTQNPIASTMLVQFLFYENQPQFLNGIPQWLTVPGDGLTAGSTNFMLWPTNPKPYVNTGVLAQAPWQGFDLPSIPVSNTIYLPTPRPGNRTIAITCNWGWVAVADLIKDLTLKMASRAWLSRQDAWAATSGDASIGTVDMSHHFDSRDEALLIESGFVRLAI